MSWIAEYDTQGREFPTCVHVTKTTGTMTHGATYVPIEDGKAVRTENDKLRQLVRNLYACINNRDCDYCEYVDEACEFERNMRELGVEV